MKVRGIKFKLGRLAILEIKVADELWYHTERSGIRNYKLSCLEFPHDPSPPRVSGVTFTLLWLTATFAF